jgi:hypothetical protein
MCEPHLKTVLNNQVSQKIFKYGDNISFSNCQKLPRYRLKSHFASTFLKLIFISHCIHVTWWVVIQFWILIDQCKTHLRAANHALTFEIPYFNVIIFIGRAKSFFWWVEVQWYNWPIMSIKSGHQSCRLYISWNINNKNKKHNESIHNLQRKD